MKITYVCPFFYPVKGGMENHVLNLARQMVKKGHEVEVLTSNSLRNKKINIGKENYNGISIVRFNTLFNIGEFSPVFISVLNYIRKSNSDIIHVHAYRQPHNLVPFFSSKKSVLTLHWPNYPKGLRNYIIDKIIPVFDKTLGKIILKKYNKLIALNIPEKEWIINNFNIDKNKISIIPNGIPSFLLKNIKSSFKKRYKIKNKLLSISIARLNKSKGLDQVIEVADSFPDVMFVIIGSNDPNSKNLEELSKNKINILILKDLSDKEKFEALNDADIFIHPSHYEAFGIVVLEAFSRKCAVITSDRGGLPSVVGNAGLIFEDNNLVDLKDKISILISNKKLLKKLQLKGYNRVKNFTWDSISNDLEILYKELLK